MEIVKNLSGTKLDVKVIGRLDTTTAPQLETEIDALLSGLTAIELDFQDLEYISSAGLRLLLKLQKSMNKQGYMKILHVNPEVQEVFEITGFSEILSIE